MENKLSESKSVHINFTIRKVDPVTVYINGLEVSFANTAKYLCSITKYHSKGFDALDTKIKWKAHVKTKKEEPTIEKNVLLLDRNSQLSVENKLLLYRGLYGLTEFSCGTVQRIQTWKRYKPFRTK